MAGDDQGCKRGPTETDEEPKPKQSADEELLSEPIEKPASKGSGFVSKDMMSCYQRKESIAVKEPAWKSVGSVSEYELLSAQSTVTDKPVFKRARSVSEENEPLSAPSKSTSVGNLSLKRPGFVSEDEPQKKRTKTIIETNNSQVASKSDGDHHSLMGESEVPRSVTLDMVPIDVIQEILMRLPSIAILRFRSVCRSWHAMLTDRQFLHEHHRLQQAKPLLIYCDDHTSSQLTLRVDSSDLYRCENAQVFHYNDTSAFKNALFQVRGSCNGLLLISQWKNTFICNPCTRCWALIPRFKVLGFYNISDYEYRILHASAVLTSRKSMVLGGLAEQKNKFYIYDVTSRNDRHLGCPMPSKALEEDIEKTVHLLVNSMPAMFNNSLHWWLPSTRKIVLFHTAQEKFHFMKAPPVDTRTWSPFCVIDSELSLGLFDETMHSLDVWTLEDYYAENWSLKFRIELAAPPWGLVSNDEEVSPVFLLSEGKNLIMHYMDHFVHARSTTDLMVQKVYHTPKHKALLASYLLKPTLVPHSFLDRYDNDKLPSDHDYGVFRKGFPFFKRLVSETRYFENAVIIGGSMYLVDVLRSICHTVTKIQELQSGDAAFKKKDYKTAIKHYNEAMKNKEDEVITAKRAISYLNLGMLHECIRDCDMILEKREGISSNVLAKSLGTKGLALSKLAKSSEDLGVGIGLMQEASDMTKNEDFKGFLAKALAAAENARNKFREKAMNAISHA